MLSEIMKQRQISHDITYVWNLKIIQMNLYIKEKQTHRHRKKLTVSKRKVREGQTRSMVLKDINYYIGNK